MQVQKQTISLGIHFQHSKLHSVTRNQHNHTLTINLTLWHNIYNSLVGACILNSAVIYECSINKTGKTHPPCSTPLPTINTTEKTSGEESDFTHRGFSSDEGDFSSSEKLFPVISWVELSCKGLKLVSSVSKCLMRPLSSCDRWEEVPRDGRLIVTWGC